MVRWLTKQKCFLLKILVLKNELQLQFVKKFNWAIDILSYCYVSTRGGLDLPLFVLSVQEFCLSESIWGRDKGGKVGASVSYGHISSCFFFNSKTIPWWMVGMSESLHRDCMFELGTQTCFPQYWLLLYG